MSSRLLALALSAALASGCARGSAAVTAPSPERLQLFLLAGQSNMAGRGAVEDQDRIIYPRLFMLDRALAWVPAVDPVHFDKAIAGVGPGRAFGIALVARDSSTRIGLVPVAVGGSPISTWEPGVLYAATGTHPYDDAIVRARAAMATGDLKAILWHQGESDANATDAPRYAERLRALIARFRADLGMPDLPFIIGELGRFDSKPWDAPREAIDSVHRLMPSLVPNTAYVSSAGLKDKGDATHFTAEGARELGARYALAYLALVQH
ncbi:MAG: sialate O-acetylesterase [Gemmatimonadaceae bacterium]